MSSKFFGRAPSRVPESGALRGFSHDAFIVLFPFYELLSLFWGYGEAEPDKSIAGGPESWLGPSVVGRHPNLSEILSSGIGSMRTFSTMKKTFMIPVARTLILNYTLESLKNIMESLLSSVPDDAPCGGESFARKNPDDKDGYGDLLSLGEQNPWPIVRPTALCL